MFTVQQSGTSWRVGKQSLMQKLSPDAPLPFEDKLKALKEKDSQIEARRPAGVDVRAFNTEKWCESQSDVSC